MNPFQAAISIPTPAGEGHDRLSEAIGTDLHWLTSEAVCAQVDTEMFFPEKGGSTRSAKRVCSSCPLITACLDYALRHQTFGVWGGTSDRERRRIRIDGAA